MFSAGTIIDDKLYYSCNRLNGLNYIDLNNGLSKHICAFLGENTLSSLLHVRSIIAGDRIVFIPGLGGNSLHIYDYVHNSMTRIEIEKIRGWNGNAYYDGQYIWLIPYIWGRGKNAKRIKLNSNEIEDIDIGDEKYLIKRIGVYQKKIVFIDENTSEIILFYLDNNNRRVCFRCKEKAHAVYIINDDFWITLKDTNKVIVWNERIGVKEMLEFPNDNVRNGFGHIVKLQNKVCLLPIEGSSIFVHDLVSGGDDVINNGVNRTINTFDIYGDEIICFPFRNNIITRINPFACDVDELCVKLDYKTFMLYCSNLYSKSIIPENQLFDFSLFVRGVNGI